jgi:hypothetical protein
VNLTQIKAASEGAELRDDEVQGLQFRVRGGNRPNRLEKTLRERFDDKWEPELNTGCWLWTGADSRLGYGRMRLPVPEARTVNATHVAWMVYRGPIPDGVVLCHRCDTPQCVNPDHLFLGTLSENIMDSINKGRRWRGETAPRAKLTNADVLAIRASPGRVTDLAIQYGVSTGRISNIRHRKIWKHL